MFVDGYVIVSNSFIANFAWLFVYIELFCFMMKI